MPTERPFLPRFSSWKPAVWCVVATVGMWGLMSGTLIQVQEVVRWASTPLIVAGVVTALVCHGCMCVYCYTTSPVTLRHKVSKTEAARLHPYYERFQFFVTCVGVGSYVYLVDRMTVLPGAEYQIQFFYDSTKTAFQAWIFMEVWVISCFLSDYLFQLWSAPSRFTFSYSYYGVVDFLSYTAFCLAVLVAQQSWVYQPLVMIGPLRMLRLRRAFRSFDYVFEESARNLLENARAAATVLLTVRLTLFFLLAASIMVALESPCEITSLRETTCDSEFQKFHLSLYFIVVTLTTVGLGDVTPSTIPGRIFVVGLILFGIVWVPYQVNVFLEVWDDTRTDDAGAVDANVASVKHRLSRGLADDESAGQPGLKLRAIQPTESVRNPASSAPPASLEWATVLSSVDHLWDGLHRDKDARNVAELRRRLRQRPPAELDTLFGLFAVTDTDALVEALVG